MKKTSQLHKVLSWPHKPPHLGIVKSLEKVIYFRKNRKYFVIGILIFSALFTPPDVISQLGIAIPLIIFYEFSVLFIKFFINKK